LATSELNRAILPYQSSPVDRLGRGHREEGEGVEPTTAKGRHGCSKPAAAPAAHLPGRNEEVLTPTAVTAIRFRGGARHPAGSRSISTLPPEANRREMAEDGEIESHGVTRRQVSGRGQPPGWFILHEQKATDSNGTVLPAHPLATEPSAPVWFAFHECARRDSNSHDRSHTVLGRAWLPLHHPRRE
jgi:hypothetical protein